VSQELAGLDVSTYGARDTVSGLDDAGNRLAELLSATVAAAPPGTTLDLYAHSQGGLVLRLALADLADTNPGVFSRLGVVVTIATPHQGAELAGLVDAVKSDPGGTELLDAAGDALGLDYRAEDPVVDELAPGSDVIRRLAAEPLPPGPTYVSIAARADLVVPSPDAHLDGAENITVPVAGLTAHDDVPGSPSTEHEIILARAGLPPSCESASDVVLDTVSGDLVQSGEQLLTSLAAP
jgi:hypothetical protein